MSVPNQPFNRVGLERSATAVTNETTWRGNVKTNYEYIYDAWTGV